MADNDSDNRCPLCGRKMNDDECFCSDCREIAENAYPNELLACAEMEEIKKEAEASPENAEEKTAHTQENNSEFTNPHPPKSSKKLIIFVLAGALLLVLIGGIGSYFFIQNKNAEETQEAYWNQCISENTPLAYSKYLVQYPEGKYSNEAQNKIMELRENERKGWEKLRKTSNVEALSAFLRDHPDTPYARDIRYAIDSLSWVATAKADTKEAYLAYIENSNLGHYAGEHIDLAQQKYDYLSQLKPMEGEDLEKAGKILTDFFKALSSTDSKDIQKATVPVLDRFFASANQESKQIADSIKSSLKKNKVKKISYEPDIKSMEAIHDNKGICFVTLPINAETDFTDRKKKNQNAKYALSIQLNKDGLIQSVEKKTK